MPHAGSGDQPVSFARKDSTPGIVRRSMRARKMRARKIRKIPSWNCAKAGLYGGGHTRHHVDNPWREEGGIFSNGIIHISPIGHEPSAQHVPPHSHPLL